MNATLPDHDPIAAFLRERGEVPMPPDLLTRARQRALERPALGTRVRSWTVGVRPALAWSAGLVALLLVVTAAAPRLATQEAVSTLPQPAVPLVLATTKTPEPFELKGDMKLNVSK